MPKPEREIAIYQLGSGVSHSLSSKLQLPKECNAECAEAEKISLAEAPPGFKDRVVR